MKPSTAVLAVFFSIAGSAQSQQSGTSIGLHRIGETVQEWLTIDKDDLTALCKSRKSWDKSNCKLLTGFRDGTRDEVSNGDNDRSYTWKATNGKLSQVTIYIPGVFSLNSNRPDIQEEIGFLIQKYGQPISTKTVPYQNSYGAKWECIKVSWTMPDGTEIIASEHIGNPSSGGSRRELMVLFLSKELLDGRVRQQQSKPNPYDH